MKKTIAIILVVLIALCSFAGCAKKEPEDKTFKVGMECNYAPFNWTQTEASEGSVPIEGGGYADGYDVQIAKKIADALGKELVIVKTEWDGLIPALQSGKIDAVIAGMSPTEERKVSVDFSEYYYKSELVVVVMADGAYKDAKALADFAGAKITGQLNTLHYSVIEQIEGVDQQTAMATFPEMIVALTSGKIDGYVSEKPGAVSAMASNSEITYIQFEGENGFTVSDDEVAVSVAVAKGNEDLLTKINEALAAITEDDRVALMGEAVENQPISE